METERTAAKMKMARMSVEVDDDISDHHTRPL